VTAEPTHSGNRSPNRPLEYAAQGEMSRHPALAQKGLQLAQEPSGCYLPLPLSLLLAWLSLAGWSLPGLSRPPPPSLPALPSWLPDRSGEAPRWLPEGSLPAVRRPAPADRDAGGWLPGGLAASAAPCPGAATARLIPASSSATPRATPMRAPTSAPTTTRSGPRRRATGPPGQGWTYLPTLPRPPAPKRAHLSSSIHRPVRRDLGSASLLDNLQVERVHQVRTSSNSRQRGTTATASTGRQPHGANGASTL
jgi:hypothetical protein